MRAAITAKVGTFRFRTIFGRRIRPPQARAGPAARLFFPALEVFAQGGRQPFAPRRRSLRFAGFGRLAGLSHGVPVKAHRAPRRNASRSQHFKVGVFSESPIQAYRARTDSTLWGAR
jgi:hypothetical protein